MTRGVTERFAKVGRIVGRIEPLVGRIVGRFDVWRGGRSLSPSTVTCLLRRGRALIRGARLALAAKSALVGRVSAFTTHVGLSVNSLTALAETRQREERLQEPLGHCFSSQTDRLASCSTSPEVPAPLPTARPKLPGQRLPSPSQERGWVGYRGASVLALPLGPASTALLVKGTGHVTH